MFKRKKCNIVRNKNAHYYSTFASSKYNSYSEYVRIKNNKKSILDISNK